MDRIIKKEKGKSPAKPDPAPPEKKEKKYSGVLLLVLLFVAGIVSETTRAAEQPTMTLVGPVGLVRAGDLIPIEVRIDSQGGMINAVEATIRFTPSAVTVERVGQEQSPLTLWPEVPVIDAQAGTVHFTGGRPGGFFATQATVATLYIRVANGGAVTLTPDSTSTAFYLNDGAGTRLSVNATPLTLQIADALVQGIALTSTTHPTPDSWSKQGTIVIQWTAQEGATYSYTLDTDPSTVPDDTPEATTGEKRYEQLADGVYYFTIKERSSDGTWSPVTQRRFLIDSTPPEQFSITKLDPKTVGGVSLLSWASSDATSGIASYALTVDGKTVGAVVSPRALLQSWRGKTLTITAKDQAGNEQSATWKYQAATPFSLSLRGRVGLFVGIFVGAAALLALAAVLLLRQRKHKR